MDIRLLKFSSGVIISIFIIKEQDNETKEKRCFNNWSKFRNW